MSTNDQSAMLALTPADHGTTIHIGRYALHRQIARGGMATIHIARLMGDEGFSRIVAAKRLLPEFAEDVEFVAMFLDEARIASRVHHRNVVPVLDVVTTGEEVVLVQEYVHGVPLHWLLNRARQTKAMVPVEIAVAIACQVLSGLHAAHETTDEMGAPLSVVHRDVSPQNVMIATDGTARLLDFGVAKSLMAAHVTREGTYKGKLAYSAPEQLLGAAVRQSDIYSLTVLLWELLVGHRMHRTAQAEAELVATIMNGKLPTITEAVSAQRDWAPLDDQHWKQLQAIEPIIKRGLAVEIEDRFQTASEMEEALLALVRPASGTAIAQWLRTLGKDYMDKHDKVLAAEEASWRRANGGQAQMSFRRAHSTTVPLRPVGTRLGPPPKADEPASSPSAVLPSPPAKAPSRAPYLLVALLSLLVVALAIGIVVVVRGKSDAAAPVASPAGQPAEPAAAADEAAAAAKPVAAEPPAAAPATAEPSLSIGEVETSPTSPQTTGAAPRAAAAGAGARPPVRPALRPGGARPAAGAKAAATTPAPTPTKAAEPPPAETKPAAETKPPAKDNCNPPYYFEGTKKIFKPACL